MAIRARAPDQLLLRFCRTGDPGALGELFDCTAVELLRVAVWLCGNRTDAEDLLQRTFVSVIESRAAYDPRRRALPWLCGILGNHARKLQEQRARVLAAATTPVDELDPALAAADRELAAEVTRLRQELGAPYGEVLDLHLGQGMNAKEIAVRLGRPAGTVRTQLMRALELLRKRLPSGFLAGFAPLAPDAAALFAVKAAVMTAARSAMPVATATGTATTVIATGGVLMAKKILFVAPALILLLGVAIYGGWPWTAADQTQPTQPTPANAAKEQIARGPKDATAAFAASPDRQLFATSSPDGDPGFASLRVQVRWQHDGSPAAGIGVSLMLARSSSLRHDGVTATDGTCTLRHLSPARWRLSCSHANADEVVDLASDERRTADLIALRQATARGTVLDEAGRAVADARIWVANGKGPDSRQYDVTRSDARGWFVVPVFSKQLIGARKSGQAPSLARAVDATTGDCEIVLRMRGAAAGVHGTVRDPEARPVRARVQIGPSMQLWAVAGPFENLVDAYGEQVVTGADGVFAFDDLKPEQACVHVWAEGFAPDLQLLSLAADRSDEVDIRLEREAVVAGTVQETDGKPVAEASISVPRHPRDLWLHSYPSVRSDAAGHFELHELPPGEIELVASKDQADHSAAKTRLQLVAGARTEWSPVLVRGRHIRGTVFGPDGAPMAGVCLGPMGADDVHARYLVATDAGGQFALVVGDEPMTVEVGDLKHEPLKTIPDVAPDTDELEIRITHADLPTATISGRFVDEAGNPVAASVGVEVNRGMGYIRDVKTDSTGAFLLGPMRPEQRELKIETRDHGRVLVDPVELAPDQTRNLGTITVPRPGSATFALFDERGEPVEHGRVHVSEPNGGHRHVGGAAVENGRGAIDALPPGRWRVVTDHRGIGPAEIEIQSGVSTHLELRPRR